MLDLNYRWKSMPMGLRARFAWPVLCLGSTNRQLRPVGSFLLVVAILFATSHVIGWPVNLPIWKRKTSAPRYIGVEEVVPMFDNDIWYA